MGSLWPFSHVGELRLTICLYGARAVRELDARSGLGASGAVPDRRRSRPLGFGTARIVPRLRRTTLGVSLRALSVAMVVLFIAREVVAQQDMAIARVRTLVPSDDVGASTLRARIRASRLSRQEHPDGDAPPDPRETVAVDSVTEGEASHELTDRQRRFLQRRRRLTVERVLTESAGMRGVATLRPPPLVLEHVRTQAERHDLPPALILGVIQVESAFDANAVSEDGAVGLMQIMPDTADLMGCDRPTEPGANVTAGTAYLARMVTRYGGDLNRALAAYNAGPDAVDRHGGMPPYAETRAYVEDVLAAARAFAREATHRGPRRGR